MKVDLSLEQIQRIEEVMFAIDFGLEIPKHIKSDEMGIIASTLKKQREQHYIKWSENQK